MSTNSSNGHFYVMFLSVLNPRFHSVVSESHGSLVVRVCTKPKTANAFLITGHSQASPIVYHSLVAVKNAVAHCHDTRGASSVSPLLIS
jgi:hypothetical protein